MNKKNLANALILSVDNDEITLYPGQADNMPTVPFFATGSQLGEVATIDNSEIVEVTAIAGDVLTVNRAQRGTVEQALGEGWVLGNGIYTQDLDAIMAYVDAAVATAKQEAKEEAYPVGSIYYNETDSTNPATLLGFGTWTATLLGLAPVGKANSGTFSTAGETVGAETHTLTLAQIPNVTGSITPHGSEGGSMFWKPNGVFGGSPTIGQYRSVNGVVGGASSITRLDFNLGGGGQAHNNIQPSKVVYAWRRTA